MNTIAPDARAERVAKVAYNATLTAFEAPGGIDMNKEDAQHHNLLEYGVICGLAYAKVRFDDPLLGEEEAVTPAAELAGSVWNVV